MREKARSSGGGHAGGRFAARPRSVPWLLYGTIALLAAAPPAVAPKGPTKPSTKPGGPSGGGSAGGRSAALPRGGDVISYYLDIPGSGMIVVKTSESPSVDWGAPELKPDVLPTYQAMRTHWGSLVDEAGVDFRVPSNEIFAVMYSESQGIQKAKSNKGALGLMQVMPYNFPKGTVDPYDPRTNIRAGVALLAQGRAQGSRDLVQMASMYNAGPPAGPPRTNDQNPALATRWGYLAQPGYIDSVVAAFNTGVKLFGVV
jgi:soluble lytic murein transglycosylase-like protein